MSGHATRDLDALLDFIRARRARPFEWGSHANDCVSYAAAAARAQTGRDVLAELGVSWSGKVGAARVLKRLGGLANAMDSVLVREVPAMLRRGDVGAIDGAGGLRLVVVEGDTVVGPGIKGEERLSRSALLMGWSLEPETP